MVVDVEALRVEDALSIARDIVEPVRARHGEVLIYLGTRATARASP